MDTNIIVNEEDEKKEEKDLRPTPPPKLAPRGIRAFTVYRKEDESGVWGIS